MEALVFGVREWIVVPNTAAYEPIKAVQTTYTQSIHALTILTQ